MKTCSIKGCDGAHSAKGLCNTHYLRKWRNGSTEDPKIRTITAKQKKEICNHYLAGYGLKRVASMFDISEYSTINIVKTEGIEVRTRAEAATIRVKADEKIKEDVIVNCLWPHEIKEDSCHTT